MPIEVFCMGCKDFTPMNIIETVEMEPGLDEHHFKCAKCGYDWWEVDDYRDELDGFVQKDEGVKDELLVSKE